LRQGALSADAKYSEQLNIPVARLRKVI